MLNTILTEFVSTVSATYKLGFTSALSYFDILNGHRQQNYHSIYFYNQISKKLHFVKEISSRYSYCSLFMKDLIQSPIL